MRLREAVEERIRQHGSQGAAARAMGFSSGHLSNLKSGDFTKPLPSTCEKLGIVYVDGEWHFREGVKRKIPPGWGFR